MNLNDLMQKAVKEKKENPNKNIDIKKFSAFLYLGTRIILIYLFFIFFVGKFLANSLKYDNLFLLAIILATLTNMYIVYITIKQID